MTETTSSSAITGEGPARPGRLLEELVEELRPLEHEAREARWRAATEAVEENVEAAAEAERRLRTFFSRTEYLEAVEETLERPDVSPAQRRQLQLLALDLRENQMPAETIRELVRRSSEIEAEFFSFRAQLDGQEVSNNELEEVFRNETDPSRRRAAWEASKQIGERVGDRIRELAARRNDAAREQGYRDYYDMRLQLQELDESRMFTLLAEVAERTERPWVRLKSKLDRRLASRFGVLPEELRPWHYDDPFFQELPGVMSPDLDPVFRDADLVEISRRFFSRLGLPVDEVLERSDLYERKQKDQHAFCTNIDRTGDVRVLANLRGNERWMATLLHELGHAVYDLYIPSDLPYLLRQPPHTLSTEAIALLFDRLIRSPEWLVGTAGVASDDLPTVDDWSEVRSLERLIAVRWMLVMVHFERELFADPESEELPRLWWDLVERYQGVRRPEGRDGRPDWAAKIHFGIAPVYYQNYLLGELLASQLRERLEDVAGEDWHRSEATGRFLREEYFAPGARYRWDRLVRRTTGQELDVGSFSRALL